MNAKILITGASGYLANALIEHAATRASVVGLARNTGAINTAAQPIFTDVTDAAAVLDVVLSHAPDAIIHCAACNPGSTEADMFAVNDVGTLNVARAAQKLGCRLVSVSSDTVFNGVDAPFADGAQASPLEKNAYALSKARGEQHVLRCVPTAVVVRTSLIYGLEQIDRGTAGFADRLAAGDRLKLFKDVIRQPVHDKALSIGLCALALDHKNESGLMNIAGDEALSRYTFGVRLMDHWGITYDQHIDAVSGVGLPGLPLDLSLGLQRAKQLGLPTPGVSKVLAGVTD